MTTAPADNSPAPASSGGAIEVLRLSAPASLSMLNSTLMRFVDGLMVAQVGPVPMSAQLVAGMSAFIPESFAMGVLSVVNTYVSQNLGAGRLPRCGQYAWAGVWLAAGYSLLALPLLLLAGPLFALLGHDPPFQRLETMYFRYMVGAMLLTLTAKPLESFFYGVGRPRVVLAVSVVSNTLNLVGDYALVFGRWGLPRMELEGAAIATVGAWAVHLALLLGVFLSAEMHRLYATRRPQAARPAQGRDLVGIGWPAGVGFINDVLSWNVLLSVFVGRFGGAHLAASAAAMRWMPLSFMPAVGVSIAATALAGRYIGQRRPDLARRRTHAALALAVAYMSACGATFFLLRHEMVALFVNLPGQPERAAAETAEILRIGGQVLVCTAVFQFFDAAGIVYMGALRGAGDTRWPMVAMLVLSWTIVVGGGWAMVSALPELTSIGPWIAGSVYVVVLGIVLAWRFERGPWERFDLLGTARAQEER